MPPDTAKITAYIGLGSNLGESAGTLEQALQQLAAHPDITLLRQSGFYRSKPHGPQDQPDYVNAVAAIRTQLSAHDLLQALFSVEQAHGRERLIRWGARTLDLDLLLYGDALIDTPELTVPHPRLGERSFVIWPLAELAPDLILPDGRVLAELQQALPGDDLWLIAKP